jgi:hypothetical protein
MPNREKELGQRLAGIGAYDFDMLTKFLDIFMSYEGMVNDFMEVFQESDRLERLLKTFPLSTDINTAISLSRKGWIQCASSAATILRAGISGHFVSPTKRETQESTSANEKYGSDPISIEEGHWESHMHLLVSLVRTYDLAPRSPAFFFHLSFRYISVLKAMSGKCCRFFRGVSVS